MEAKEGDLTEGEIEWWFLVAGGSGRRIRISD